MVLWLEALSAGHLQDEIAYFLSKRVAAIESLTEEIANVLASR
jgi:hypothetical protein